MGVPLNEIVSVPTLTVVHPAINVVQWDGRHATAPGVAAALAVVLDEIGADVTKANYRAAASNHRGAVPATLAFEIGREDDGSTWQADLHQGDWLALWVLDGRLVAVDVYDARDGEDRFVRLAPVVVLRPPLSP